MAPQYLTVQTLTKYIKRKFDADPYLADIYVKGEISNFKRHTSGHMYFTLKDERARILAVMFSSANRFLKFNPENGMKVLVRASVSVYEAGGSYQLYVKGMQPDGIGALYLAYEQLKDKLEKEGLFAKEKKRPIPAYPKVVGVVTSPTGAAVRDIITTIRRRFPVVKIILHPALVQGENAAPSIVKAIEEANRLGKADVLIVGRGGGSIEELWAFNEEMTARAIAASTIPVISAVGHETDFTIADFAADLRAPTPTAAAELAVPHIDEVREKILNMQARLLRSVREKVRHESSRLAYLERSPALKNPYRLIRQQMEQADRLAESLHREAGRLIGAAGEQCRNLYERLLRNRPEQKLLQARRDFISLHGNLVKQMQAVLREKQHRFGKNISALEALSPLKVMERGYSLAMAEDETIIKKTSQVKKGDTIQVVLTDGGLLCTVDEIRRRRENG
ncbi:exodeoxyribonuclease 7 large subunit [Weizmannia acidilactici]|mgnify:CR=1 FL=1|uniref:Exodeoxyribonuclease 7 large subunit n=1 Tax=Weizmannia acidilactici TaxID=2607726 RepID=A0A5J4JBU3_9BACI|nr:exodeoxyribonuclease VII large subunit [Weizmannia acidilactici]GER66133.1 exodeoxyribonuclease 7 large subunit [Weizmannia acidilactici]GER69231.1 exodeoxyribonuclease 7 large subunit [Weizmannia acidilactici]GER72442.1 exodeoxyribonuclease 7 large subunit [Weizmannia acidilactici]